MSYDSRILVDAFQGDLTTLAELQLRCGFSDHRAAAMCCVSPETYRRWRSDRTPNPTAIRLLAILAGYVPWSGWSGWEVHNGRLFPPGYTRHGIGPGDVLAVHYQNQLLDLYRRQLRASRPDREGPAMREGPRLGRRGRK